MRKRSLMVAAATATMICLGVSAAYTLQPPAQETETYRATAQSMGQVVTTAPDGPSGQVAVLISITRWSTEEERSSLLAVLAEDGTEPLADALGKQEEVGFLRFLGAQTRFPSVRLNYARQFMSDGKRNIVLATTGR